MLMFQIYSHQHLKEKQKLLQVQKPSHNLYLHTEHNVILEFPTQGTGTT